jgi:chromosomal replication initiator protein
MTDLQLIKSETETYFSLPPGTLDIKCRKPEISKPRQLAHYLACWNNDDSVTKIGVIIGCKHHATVNHSCRVINNAMGTDHRGRVVDPEIKQAVEELKQKINPWKYYRELYSGLGFNMDKWILSISQF